MSAPGNSAPAARTWTGTKPSPTPSPRPPRPSANSNLRLSHERTVTERRRLRLPRWRLRWFCVASASWLGPAVPAVVVGVYAEDLRQRPQRREDQVLNPDGC